ncbi:MAG: VanZ family protein [Schleiferilactobacillus perolens]|jgi:glycopeptide antibiotics resistance protein|uniref:VanZ family protein n=1 Tax=Schleiferilactobacillus perolens TaxID=100468 RepID=UPI0039EBD6B3|nr:VanZ family protein [Schleiferilactobacillus harbinensis]MCI1913789.1 VanZ family protein [Schleiferilactobacillus harbinensis]
MIRWLPALILFMLWLTGLLIARPWQQSRSGGRALAVALLWMYLLVLIPVCFMPFATHHGAWSGMAPIMVGTAPTNPIPFRGGFTPDFWLNILMTVPFGFLLQTLFPLRWWQVLLWGLALSLVIEGGQFIAGLTVQLNRWADVNDLITNTTGAVLGSLFRLLWGRLRVK